MPMAVQRSKEGDPARFGSGAAELSAMPDEANSKAEFAAAAAAARRTDWKQLEVKTATAANNVP